MTTTLVLVRHAHAEPPAIWEGPASDYVTGLTSLGWDQARKLAAKLDAAPIRIYTSPFRRTIQTAQVLWEAFHAPLVVEADLRERVIGAGPHSGEEVEIAHERSFRELTYRLPGGESLLDAQQRFTLCLNRLALANPDGEILVVTHGTVSSLFVCNVRNQPPALEYQRRIPNAGYARVVHDGVGFRIAKDFLE